MTADLIRALEFYSDPAYYKAPFTGGMGALYFDCGAKAREALAAHRAQAPAEGDEVWPKLTKSARVGGGVFRAGVSSRYVVEAAQRQQERAVAEGVKTPEQRREDEANRRALWDMVHGPLEAQPQPKGAGTPALYLSSKQVQGVIEGKVGASYLPFRREREGLFTVPVHLATRHDTPAAPMTAQRAAYFMERFKHEEKLLGPNEQAALDFVITMLESAPAPSPAPAPATGDTNGRRDGLRPAVHGRVPVGGYTPGALADLLFASRDVMSLNAELDLTMDQLVQLTQAVLTAVPSPAVQDGPVALTIAQVQDLVREADLDWHRGWAGDPCEVNRYLTLVRSVERHCYGIPKPPVQGSQS